MNPINKKLKSNNDQQQQQQPENNETDQQKSIEDSITNQLKNRMLISGEWLRLQKILMNKLRGSNWEENLRCEAEARALDKDNPTLSKLINHLRPIAQNTIPEELKQEIAASISKFIKANIEEQDDDDDDDDDDGPDGNGNDDDDDDDDDEAMEEVV
ncbi:hypothetical protein MJO28_011677 [Puccinia striiformis f. sp. tritici]|uniref:Uncharacterized protein n=1 Tax=Puccinia striiformis f. sp. tritici TaxID=168172 RepID=A0ACC0E4T8_9BASI|nr:hypothetical protein MJO28_011677 [Puccinia striiformis f. sp. tritici]